MAKYESISEIYPEDQDRQTPVPPLADWEIEVLERDLNVNLGDVGGRESLVANARVRVTENDGTSWVGLTRLK